MREIKFRAFDNEKKEIIDSYEISIKTLNPFINRNLALMQFTGFKDKKGREIYEGDILSDEVKINNELIVSKHQVFWNEISGNWSLDYSYNQDKTACCALHADLNKFKYEIIGNIYENPELVSNSK